MESFHELYFIADELESTSGNELKTNLSGFIKVELDPFTETDNEIMRTTCIVKPKDQNLGESVIEEVYTKFVLCIGTTKIYLTDSIQVNIIFKLITTFFKDNNEFIYIYKTNSAIFLDFKKNILTCEFDTIFTLDFSDETNIVLNISIKDSPKFNEVSFSSLELEISENIKLIFGFH